MDSERLLKEIRMAESGVTEAESHLAKLLAEIQFAPRAEKTTLSNALQQAFDKLRESRRHLISLEEIVRGVKD
ncbi:MAG TPA: hypothetical protein VIY73_22555 [Polyangiaceae bacterium]